MSNRLRFNFSSLVEWSAFGLFGTAGFLILCSPLSAQGEEEGEGAPQEIATLKSKVAILETTLSALEKKVSSVQAELAMLRTNRALALDPFVTIDLNERAGVTGPHIIIKGANVHIVSGSGFTDDADHPTGLGNLIIGYDEPPGGLTNIERGGSHNLVVGRYNRFTQAAFGGFVAGQLNTISNKETSVTGGANNTASGLFASVSGGQSNIASGGQASVSGGVNNVASGSAASISGGESNICNSSGASVSGGMSNTASGSQASVSGGDGNVANGPQSSVSGGAGNTAAGSVSAVIGGQNVTDNVDGAIRPQPPFTP